MPTDPRDRLNSQLKLVADAAEARALQISFLNLYRASGNIALACRKSGVTRHLHLKWLREDLAYKVEFNEAQEDAADLLEQEARRRAVDGVEKPVFFKGEMVGFVTDYSDGLLTFLLKGARPEKYRDRFEISNPQEERRKLAAILGCSEQEIEAALAGARAGGLVGTPLPEDPGPNPQEDPPSGDPNKKGGVH